MVVKSNASRRAIARQDRIRSLRRAQAVSAVAPQPDLITTKGLDFLSLAVCSCALTLLCHSATTPLQMGTSPASSTTARPPAMSNSGTPASFVPFTLVSPQPEVKDDEE